MQTMKASVKRDWIEALRSGEYKQGRFALCRSGTWCCLGVLRDVAIEGDWTYKGDGYWSDGRNGGTLSRNDRKRVGLRDDSHAELVRFNDGEQLTFDKIADWIEANL